MKALLLLYSRGALVRGIILYCIVPLNLIGYMHNVSSNSGGCCSVSAITIPCLANDMHPDVFLPGMHQCSTDSENEFR